MKTDSVHLEIFNNHFSAIANEMGYIIWRTAFTAYVKETWDFAQGLVTKDGEIFAYSKDIGGAPFLGLPLGDMVRQIDFSEGDIIICNDPYSTAGMCTHLPDIHLVKPCFHNGELLCFVWDFIHAADVGGIVPGSAPPSTYDIHQEGVRIPPAKLFKAGRVDQEVKNFLLANTRVPHEMWGDIKALLAALNTAERRMAELVERYGLATIQHAMEDVLEYAEVRARSIFTEIRDGSYTFVDYVEGFPGTEMPYRIELSLRVSGSEVTLDFTGTDIQMPCSYNIPTDGKTHHFLTFGLVSYIRSRDPACPLNGGLVRPIRVKVPKGTLLNPHPGASCSVRFVTAERVFDVVMGALAQAHAPLVPAAGGGCVAPIMYSVLDPSTGRYKLGILQMLLGGMGGRPGLDGVNGADFTNAFFRNGPNEMAEAELPVLVRHYGWDSSAPPAGRWRGGLGVVYEFESLSPSAVMTARCMERERFRPWGRDGGEAGSLIRSTLNPDTESAKELGKIDVLNLKAGDVVQIRMPSGGGFGDPMRREPAAVGADIAAGALTEDEARSQYGVVVTQGAVDSKATGELRGRQHARDCQTFSFGTERDHYEQVFPQSIQRKIVAKLLEHSTARARYCRNRLWEQMIEPALEHGKAVDERQAMAIVSE